MIHVQLEFFIVNFVAMLDSFFSLINIMQ